MRDKRDPSEGWDEVAERFIAARSEIGVTLVRSWARDALPAGGVIVDVGCGSGVPIARGLIEDGFTVFGIDASPILVDAFRRRFPKAPAVCEAAQDSGFFGRRFDAAVSIGLLFLLSPDHQRAVIRRVADALGREGRFLFSAPREACAWQDSLTGRRSRSLGIAAYARLLTASGMSLVGCHVDDGGNHHYDAVKPVGS